MKILETLNRIEILHNLIKNERTGNPEYLSKKIGVSRATLYKIIEELKSYNAPIKYSRIKESFYYESSFHIEVRINILKIKQELDFIKK